MRNRKGQFAAGGAHHTTHGLSKSAIYGIWRSMLNRCLNPNVKAYKDYGGRGISVCKRWQVFTNFFADMGHRPPGRTLDRIDNDAGYSLRNCRWADHITQARNKRKMRRLEVNGVNRALVEWSDSSGIKLATIWARLKKGWPPEKAVSAPIRISGRWSEPVQTERRDVA